MNRLRKLVVLLLVLSLSALAAAGCGRKPLTAFSLMEDMGRSLSAQDSFTASVTGGTDLGVASGGVTMGVKMDFVMDVEMLREPGVFHADGTAAVNMLGMDADMPLEIYGRIGEPLTLYVKVLDTWFRQQTELNDVSPVDLSLSDLKNLQELTDCANLLEETEEIGGHTAYRIDMTLPGSLLKEIAEKLDTDIPDAAESLDWDALTLNAVFWIDTQTRLPVRQSIWFDGDLPGSSLRISRLQAQIDYTGFGTVENIVIPPEALNAPEPDKLLDALLQRK